MPTPTLLVTAWDPSDTASRPRRSGIALLRPPPDGSAGQPDLPTAPRPRRWTWHSPEQWLRPWPEQWLQLSPEFRIGRRPELGFRRRPEPGLRRWPALWPGGLSPALIALLLLLTLTLPLLAGCAGAPRGETGPTSGRDAPRGRRHRPNRPPGFRSPSSSRRPAVMPTPGGPCGRALSPPRARVDKTSS